MTRRRKIGWWIVGIVLTPIVLVAMLIGALYLPPVQQWAVRKACAYASEATGMDIRLERIRLTPLLDLDLQGVLATTPPDTILSLRHVGVDLDLTDILKGRVGVDALDLKEGRINTLDLIATVVVKGEIGNLHLHSDNISLKQQRAMLTGARLDRCNVDIAMRDTTVIDTTESAPLPWSIGLGDIEAYDTRIAFHTPGDTVNVSGGVRELIVRGGNVNLEESIYEVRHLRLNADSILYDTLALRNIQLETKHLLIDSTHVHIPELHLKTPHSHADGEIRLDWSALTPRERGRMDADIEVSLGLADMLAVAPLIFSEKDIRMLRTSPVAALELELDGHGNVDQIDLKRCRLTAFPMAEASVNGQLTNVLDSEELGADLNLDVKAHDLSFLRRWLGLTPSVVLPKMQLTGDAHLHDQQYEGDFRLQQGRGLALLKGRYNARTEAYDASLDVRKLNLHNFLPKDSIYGFTGRAKLNGRGTDLLSKHARGTADVVVEHLQYGQNQLDSLRLMASVKDGKGQVNLSSHNSVLEAEACADLLLDRKVTNAEFTLGLNRIDLHRLGIVEKPLAISMVMQVEGNSNLSDTHELQGSIRAVELMPGDTIFYPTDIELSLLMSSDTIHAEAKSGDLALKVASHEGLEQLLEKSNQFVSEATRQFEVHTIDQDTLKSLLPEFTAHISSGNQNTMAHIVKSLGYTFDRLNLDLESSPFTGINGQGYLHALNTGSILLDTIQWHIRQDTSNVVRMEGRVRNGPRNRQVVFESKAKAALTPTGAEASIIFHDAKGRKGVDLGAQLFMEDDGYRVHLHPLHPILAYRYFTLNEDNFVYLHDDNRLEANIDLLADDGTGFKLYSTPNDDALQDLTLSVHDFNLGELSAVIPYMPSIGGMLGGDFHLVMDEQSTSVLVDAQVNGLSYENAPLGLVGLNAVYLPNADGTHYVDGIVSHDGNEVMTLAGTYNPADGGTIDAQGALFRLPLALANGFIPDQMIELSGYVTGDMSVKGNVSKPIIDGAIGTDSMHVNSDMYSLALRFPNDTIGIRQSHLDFNRIEAYSTGRNPLVLDGTIDLRELDRIGLNLSLSAQNFELINAPKSQRAVAYGKVYVDAGARLSGTLNDMLLRGKLSVLGNTDVTYVLTDSPLTTDDQLADLVTFVDFSDTLSVAPPPQASPQHIDMTMDINIAQAAQVHCLLSPDGTNHIDLEGGGDLTMTYTTQEGLQLFGRYTILSGTMNYTLMVVALKNLSIHNGSYVEFGGNMTNPKLNISASERVKTTVYENNVPRSVNFDVGLNVSQNLENMGLEFTLEAPSDMTVSNQLATMSAEERGKVAVTMLATGMYITESGNGTSGFSATNALNSFLQTQLAAISSKALSTIDLNFGIDNTNTASGGTQTDYSFSFAKRFWGNRISLIVGGKVSSGSEAENTAQSIINNISVEYRLDKGGTRFVRLYYDHETESLLEGDITEMGAGIVFRKKSTRLGDLFLFRKERKVKIEK